MSGMPVSHGRRRIGIDVGGTFTDLVLLDGVASRITNYKEPSTPADPSLAVERGIPLLLQRAGLQPSDIDLVVHGTTLGLNTIIQRSGAAMALVVSRGNKDILEIARLEISNPFDMFCSKEMPLVPRDLVMEVSARTRVDGAIEGEFAEQEVQAIVRQLEARGISAVAVCLLNSYRHPRLEAKVAQCIRATYPGALVTASAQLWPEMREYERAMVACLNAYIHPQLDAYFTRLSERLKSIAIKAPIYITANNGGTIGIDTARERPIDTILSGPASGVIAACSVANECDFDRFMSVDIGGTSSDMSLTVGGKPEYSTRSMVGEFPLILPVVNVSAIGAGGGSIVWVDSHGILKVGPRSAGASPGPIAYGRGGTEPTITDCYLCLGVLRGDGFLDGRMQLDEASACAALEALGRQLGYSGEDVAARTAEAALKVATAKMATEVHRGAAQRGLDVREFPLVPLGGAGPTHSGYLAEEVGMVTILVPRSPGTLCAMGAVQSDLRRDYVRSIRQHVGPSMSERLRAVVSDIRREADMWIQSEVAKLGVVSRIEWTAEIRYAQEGIGLTVSLPAEAMQTINLEAIAEAFHREHEAVYGFYDDDAAVELLALHAQVIGALDKVAAAPHSSRAEGRNGCLSRRVFLDGRWQVVPVHRRGDLAVDAKVFGPAIIEQEDTTTWILGGWQAAVLPTGVLKVVRAGH